MGEMRDVSIRSDKPSAGDVAELLQAHLALAHEVTPPGHVHALDGAGLEAADISFFSARMEDGELVAVGALRDLGAGHFEIKSMHTAAAHRGLSLIHISEPTRLQ